MRYACGVDIGASATKVVVIDDERRVVGKAVGLSGIDYEDAASRGLAEALEQGGITRDRVVTSLATGYGRNNVPWVDGEMTEIACHAKGAYSHFEKRITVIDIGAQDNKVIQLEDDGKRIGFKMNRKCAAGTGAFLEEIAHRMAVPIAQLNGLAESATEEVTLGSFCTVFTATEILAKIRDGEKVEGIVKGAFRSVVKRVFEMETMTGTLVMTGGVVEHNPYLAVLASESFGNEVLVPPDPQHTGALGAALLAMEKSERGDS